MKKFAILPCLAAALFLFAGCGERTGKPAGNIIVVQKSSVDRQAPAENPATPSEPAATPAEPAATPAEPVTILPKPAPAPAEPVAVPAEPATVAAAPAQPVVESRPAAPAPQPAQPQPTSNMVQKNGLTLTLSIPETRLVTGQTFVSTLTVKNTTDKPVTIPAVGNSPVFARIFHQAVTFQEEVKHYPQTGTVVMNNWILAPGQEKKFSLTLTVEPDWPTNEPLKLTMELNGLPKAAPAVDIRVTPE